MKIIDTTDNKYIGMTVNIAADQTTIPFPDGFVFEIVERNTREDGTITLSNENYVIDLEA